MQDPPMTFCSSLHTSSHKELLEEEIYVPFQKPEDPGSQGLAAAGCLTLSQVGNFDSAIIVKHNKTPGMQVWN
jgi:hypothetical protein